MDGQGLADVLAGAGGAPVNRAGLNSFIATSQARNGLVSAQTQDAMIKAAQAQEQMAAWDKIHDDFVGMGAPESEASLMRDALVGATNHDPKTAVSVLGAAKLGYGNGPSQVAGQQMVKGQVAGPVALPNNFIQPVAPAGGSPFGPPQQSTQGVAQTQETKAITAEDIAKAEEAHRKAQNQTGGASALDPGTVDMAARVVMADPSKMNSYAGFGNSGQANKNAINNRQAALLTEAGMTPEDMIRQRAIAKASVGSAGAAAKQSQILDAFMPLVKANGDRITQLLDQMAASGVTPDTPIVNGFSRMLGRNLGSADLAELHSVFTTYQNEVARLLAAGPSMNGVISDHARNDIQAMAPENMTTAQARRVVNRIDTEMGIRRHSVQSSLESATGAQLPVISQPTEGNAPAAPGPKDSGLPPGFHPLN